MNPCEIFLKSVVLLVGTNHLELGEIWHVEPSNLITVWFLKCLDVSSPQQHSINRLLLL